MMDSYRRKDYLLNLVASYSLSTSKKELNDISLDIEKDRLEKIATHFYNRDKSDREYNDFVADWIRDNAETLVHTNIYDKCEP